MESLGDRITDALVPIFERNFLERGELGASVSVFLGEEEVVNLAYGHANRERTMEWTDTTLVPVWSATKGPAALACLMALEEGSLSIEAPVCEVWQRFVGGGKEHISFAHILTHTSGLSALDQKAPILDHDAVIRAIESQTPSFVPGTKQAYQARTFGFILDEIVQRITGARSLGEYFRERIGGPMGLDFYIGLPESEWGRVATVYPGKVKVGGMDDAFLRAFSQPGSLAMRSFQSPVGLSAVQDMNRPDTWSRGFASMGGVGTASALAQFYSMLANGGWWKRKKLVSEWILQAMQHTLSQSYDEVLCTEIAFGAGMMRDPVDMATDTKLRQLFSSSLSAFGHPGAGGSLAFADPERGFGFAYVMNQMELGVLPNVKALEMVQALDAVLG
jgi:CubicO group peptidase (beta-lactamase class C family)